MKKIFEKKQEEYYDKISEVYDTHHMDKYSLNYRNYILKKVLKEDISGLRVLDAMCGGGEWTSLFLEMGAIVDGLDISKKNCIIYEKRFPSCKVFYTSILNSSIPNENYDIIITDSLHHIYSDINIVMKEIHRILKPNGIFIFFEPFTDSFMDFIRRYWYKKDKFFEEGEQSINVRELKDQNSKNFIFEKEFYGGNIAYIFILQSMIMRIPNKFKKYYAPFFIFLDRVLSSIQPKFLSCYVLGKWRKK